LINKENVDNVLNLCYNYIVGRKKIKAKIIDGKHQTNPPYKYGNAKYGTIKWGEKDFSKVITTFDEPTNSGDLIEIDAGYYGDMQGRIVYQKFNLNGGITIKDTIVR
jgi:hypothetical protein